MVIAQEIYYIDIIFDEIIGVLRVSFIGAHACKEVRDFCRPGWSVFQAQPRNVSYPTKEKIEMFNTRAKGIRKCSVPLFMKMFRTPFKRKKS